MYLVSLLLLGGRKATAGLLGNSWSPWEQLVSLGTKDKTSRQMDNEIDLKLTLHNAIPSLFLQVPGTSTITITSQQQAQYCTRYLWRFNHRLTRPSGFNGDFIKIAARYPKPGTRVRYQQGYSRLPAGTLTCWLPDAVVAYSYWSS